MISIIIPCYNAERWISEAVQSCLNQTYTAIEIIVIDDGSTDASLKVLDGYRSKIKIEIGPNRGGNYARNRGLALSSGQYIQFLDADDYLLPEKLERQLECICESGADVVYSDWRLQRHESGEVILDDIVTAGVQRDILQSLLEGMQMYPHAVLYRREALVKVGGWDETLRAAQEWDLNISLAIAGAKFSYLPGCFSVYRRYGNVTVSSSDPDRLWENKYLVLCKAEEALIKSNGLFDEYRDALARQYFQLARCSYDTDRPKYRERLERALRIVPDFRPRQGGLYDAICQLLGYEAAERLASSKRLIRRKLAHK